MITAPIDEAAKIEELDREQLKEFAKEFEKELRSNNLAEICKKLIDNRHALRFFKDVCEEVLGEDILSYLTVIPSGLYSESNIVSINIPSNIVEIKSGAFRDCEQLKRVIMPDSVTKMEESVFQGCSGLEEIRLSEKLQEIPSKTFAGCASLAELFIPDSVKRMGYDVFSNVNPNIIIKANRGVDRSEGPNDEHPKGIKMKSTTSEFMKNHIKWANE